MQELIKVLWALKKMFGPETSKILNGAASNYSVGNIQQNSMSGVSNTVIRYCNCGSKTHQHRECPD